MSGYGESDAFSYPPSIRQVQANEGPTVVEPTIDFDDTATVAWSLTDDPASGRVRVAAVYVQQNFAAAVVAPEFAAVALAGQVAFEAVAAGEANPRWFVRTDGPMFWGPGGAGGADVELARSSAQNLLVSSPLGAVGLTLGDGANEGFLSAGGAGLSVSAAKIGFFGAAPAARPTGHLLSGNWTIGSLAAVTIDSRTNGAIGSTFYTVEDLVAALKTLGLIVS